MVDSPALPEEVLARLNLSVAEAQVLVQAMSGHSDFEIARKLRLTPEEVEARWVGIRGNIGAPRALGPSQPDDESRYRSAIESLIDCFFLLDAIRDEQGEVVDFRYATVNGQAMHYMGKTPEQLLDLTLMTTFPGLNFQAYVDSYRRVMETGVPFEQEVESRVTPGVYLSLRATRAGDGVAVSMRNVTQVQSQQRALEERNEALRRLSGESEAAAAEAQKEREFLDAVLGTMDSLVCVLDREGRFVRFNHACERLSGWKAEEVCGRSFVDIVVIPDEREEVTRMFRSLTAGQFPSSYENHWVTRSGELRQIAFRNTCLTDERGEVLFVIGTGIDVTRSRAAEEEARRTNEHLELAQRLAGVGSWDLDLRTGQYHWSAPMYSLFGFPPEEPNLSLEMLAERVIEKDRGKFLNAIQRSVDEAKDVDLKYGVQLPNGEGRIFRTLFHPIPDEQRLVGTTLDVTANVHWEAELEATMLRTVEESVQLEIQRQELALMNEKLTHLATTDGLTGVANHRTFQERLDEMILQSRRSHHPMSLVLLDVDRFKRFNDDYGHQAGDSVLRDVTTALGAVCRGGDLVARYGGEEFAVLLKDADATVSRRVVERLRKAIEDFPWKYRPVTASFGVATLTESVSREELIAMADQALYASKRTGRNRCTHAEDLVAPGVAIVDACDASSLPSSASPR